jgi:hypothetical protein
MSWQSVETGRSCLVKRYLRSYAAWLYFPLHFCACQANTTDLKGTAGYTNYVKKRAKGFLTPVNCCYSWSQNVTSHLNDWLLLTTFLRILQLFYTYLIPLFSHFPPWRWGGSSTQAWMATYVSILRIPQMIRVWRATVEWYWQGKTEELGEKPVPVPLCPPQIPHGLTRARTLASAVPWHFPFPLTLPVFIIFSPEELPKHMFN